MTAAATRPLIDLTSSGTSDPRWLAEVQRRTPPLLGLELATPGRVVIVSPHPDDEVLGAGGLLRRLVHAGWRAEVVAVTDGEAAFGSPDAHLARRREAEQIQALNLLLRPSSTSKDIRPPRVSLHRLRVSDGGVSADLPHVTQQLAARIGGADLCIAPWSGDGHPDHEAVGLACELVAEANCVPIVRYPIWLWHWADPARDMPWDRARQLLLSDSGGAAKAQAIQAYVSQLGDDGRRDPILTSSVLVRFARPFEVFLV